MHYEWFINGGEKGKKSNLLTIYFIPQKRMKMKGVYDLELVGGQY